MGAPRKEVDWEAFESLCQMHCTEEEICDHFKMTHDTLVARCREKFGRTFSEVYAEMSISGRRSLRRQLWMMAMGSPAQYDRTTGALLTPAMKPNAETARFLSKQPTHRGGLGFKDAVAQTHDVGDGSYEKLMGICRELEEKKEKERHK